MIGSIRNLGQKTKQNPIIYPVIKKQCRKFKIRYSCNKQSTKPISKGLIKNWEWERSTETTHGSEEEQEAGDEEVTSTKAERKWVHGDDGEEGLGNEDFVWILRRAFISSYSDSFSIYLPLPQFKGPPKIGKCAYESGTDLIQNSGENHTTSSSSVLAAN